MALKMLMSGKLLTQAFQRLQISPAPTSFLAVTSNLNSLISRNYPGFFTKLPAEDLWKGVTSVSNAGRKRGRAKGLVRKKDLNRGQVIGIGKSNIQWPGLSAPIIRGRELVERHQLAPDPEREAKLIKLRDSMGGKRFQKITALERGWSGSKMPGRSIGSPDAIGEDNFEGFDTRVLELKTVFNMKGNLGRKRRLSGFVITGNGKGLAGFASAKAVDSRAVLRKAKNRAGQKLMYIDVCDGHGIYHDFATQFGKTKIFVEKKPEGYGLVCHRAIKTICQVIGIKDLYAKCEGSPNVQHVTKAFFLGLLRQKKFEEVAQAKGLHLVEFRKETGFFPKVLASPKDCRKEEDIRHDEIMDYTQFCMDGKLALKRKKHPMFYEKTSGFKLHLMKKEKRRNHDEVRRYMLAEYGEIRSFFADKYPEAKATRWHEERAKKKAEAEE